MNATVELGYLRSRLEDLVEQLNDVRSEYGLEVDEEYREEFFDLYTDIRRQIRRIRRVINQLALNGFIWTSQYSDAMHNMITEVSDRIELLAEFAM